MRYFNFNRFIIVFCLMAAITSWESVFAADNNKQSHNNYFRHHIIICIDPAAYDNGRMADLYTVLESLLLGEKLDYKALNILPESKIPVNTSGEFFDPLQDEISVFIMGISGGGRPQDEGGDWMALRRAMFNKSAQEVCAMIDTCLIRKVASFQSSNLPLDEFLEKKVMANLVSKGTVTKLPTLIYPLILSHVNNGIPTEETILLIISEQKAGGINTTEQHTTSILDQLFSNRKGYKDIFDRYTVSLGLPFDFRDKRYSIKIRENNASRINDPAKIYGGEIRPIALDNTGLEIYPCSFKQKRWGSDKYQINNAQLRFLKNNEIMISRIDLEITDNKGIVYDKVTWNDNIESYRNGNFIILPNATVSLAKDSSVNYNAAYVVYTDILDSNRYSIMPYVLKKAFSPAVDYAAAPKKAMPYIVIGFLLVLIGALLRVIYVFRGRKNIPNIDIDVIPISNTRYMEVKDCEVKNYDCWYVEDEKDRLRKIRFNVDLTPKKIRFAQRHRFTVKYQVEDIDHNDKFTFKPAGKADDGTDKQLNQLYSLNPEYDMSKSDSYKSHIDVDAFVDTGDQIDFCIDNILEMKLTVSLFINDKGKERKVESGQKYYKFIVKPKLRNSNIWTAFDAGTSGATIAYGITGNWLDQDEINLVQYEQQEAGSEEIKYSAIFPSVVAIPDASKAFLTPTIKVEDYTEGLDFVFGEDAEKESFNKFQSIKKFLGYRTPQLLVQRDGENEGTITGQDLAHLLVKGMYGQLKKDVDQNKNEDIREQFYYDNVFAPQRAVVAVPNNYTLNKVQDMVNSVGRLNKFKEVHYLYESEGVMMTYLRKSLPVLKEKQNCTFVVFDMGGATINVTAFGLSPRFGKNGNIHKIKLTSLAKIGYYVGGDDIDYALIQFLYSIPSVKEAISALILKDKKDSAIVTKEDVLEHQKKHKNELVDFARKIKLDWIDVQNGDSKSDNIMVSTEDFWMHLRSRISDIMNVELPIEPTENDSEFIREEKNSRSIMREYVFANISDALVEIQKSPRFPSNTSIELILSGRSVLYPGVKETILKSFKGRSVSLWNGFYKEGTELFDDQKVKTAVAEGACWYAMYSRDIELQHNYITSSYGFEDRNNNQKCYHELIKNGSEFEDDGCCRGEIVNDELCDPNINDVKFLQMMGSDADTIVKKDIRHKKNLLDEIKPDQVKTAIEKINFVVDDKGNYSYEVYQRGFEKPITRGSTRAYRPDKDILNEIKDENSLAYEFATTNTSVYSIRKKTKSINTSQKEMQHSSPDSQQSRKVHNRIK